MGPGVGETSRSPVPGALEPLVRMPLAEQDNVLRRAPGSEFSIPESPESNLPSAVAQPRIWVSCGTADFASVSFRRRPGLERPRPSDRSGRSGDGDGERPGALVLRRRLRGANMAEGVRRS